MPIILPEGLTSEEIRVLQEYRRKNAESLTLDEIKAIKHPTGGGDAPAVSLAGKGFLAATGDGTAFALTQRAKDFLAIEAKPAIEETSAAGASAAANPDSDGV